MSNQFVAEIRIFPFNFAPTGWAFCNGQLMAISQNTAYSRSSALPTVETARVILPSPICRARRRCILARDRGSPFMTWAKRAAPEM